jgi:uncharacterized membrane protein YidH (DUF202 family)
MIFRPKCEAFAAGCIKMYKNNHDLYSSFIIIIIIITIIIIIMVNTSRWMRLAECVACMGRREMHTSLRRDHLRKGDHLKI